MISGSQRVEVGVRDELVEHRGFLGQWKYSVWYHTNESIIIHLFKPIECTIPRVNPNVSHELWVTGCINVDSSSEANMSFGGGCWEWGGYEIWGQEIGESLYLPPPKRKKSLLNTGKILMNIIFSKGVALW